MTLTTIQEIISNCLHGGGNLIIIPPFAGVDRPSLGAHLLQACARQSGFDTEILYSNIILASLIGEDNYEAICYSPTTGLLGERFFSSTAFNLPIEQLFTTKNSLSYNKRVPHKKVRIDIQKLMDLSKVADSYIESVVKSIVAKNYKLIGCSTTFEQTSASISLLKRVKIEEPNIITIMGGGNCEGEMACGLFNISNCIDYIFEGESEISFPAFLKNIQNDAFSTSKIIKSIPVSELDTIPVPDYSNFYEQLNLFLPDSVLLRTGNIWLPFESSRGCWWGEKRRCRFCGINGSQIKFREKRPETFFNQLNTLLSKHPTDKVCMVDNIMPISYFKSVLPKLSEKCGKAHIFYEQKANLDIKKIRVLKLAGVEIIQPGIESLSTPLLKIMNKGVTARQNLSLLRHARSMDLTINWNILYAFPNDNIQSYQEMISLIPLIGHLNPPSGLFHLSLDRFSPYFERAMQYGISDIKPMESYFEVFPPEADLDKIAYHFVGKYKTAANDYPEVINQLKDLIGNWRNLWTKPKTALPSLSLSYLDNDRYLLIDTRFLEETKFCHFLSKEQAHLLLKSQEVNDDNINDYQWALDNKLMAIVDNNYTPLITADYQILQDIL